MREAFAWVVKLVLLPFLAIWLLLFCVVLVSSLLWGPSRPVEVWLAGTALIVLPFATSFTPLGIAAYFLNGMRQSHRNIPWSTVGAGYCDICHEFVPREKHTGNLLLLPYAFKTLRHYEKTHPEISRQAHGARLSVTLFVHSFILSFASFAGVLTLWNSQLSLIGAMSRFLAVFLPLTFTAYGMLAYLLLWKKGVGLG